MRSFIVAFIILTLGACQTGGNSGDMFTMSGQYLGPSEWKVASLAEGQLDVGRWNSKNYRKTEINRLPDRFLQFISYSNGFVSLGAPYGSRS